MMNVRVCIAGVTLDPTRYPHDPSSRLVTVLRNSSGFVYYVSIAGITGTQSATAGSMADAIEQYPGMLLPSVGV